MFLIISMFKTLTYVFVTKFLCNRYVNNDSIFVIRDVAKETTSKERDLKKLKRQYEENESFKAEQNDELEKLQEKLHEYNESERNFTGIQTKITEAKNNLKHMWSNVYIIILRTMNKKLYVCFTRQ